MIDAQTAHRLGILNHLFPADQFEASVAAFAKKIAEGPQLAIRTVKQAIFGREKDALMEALEREVQAQLKCFHSHDCLEGIRAFMEKRQPKFQGS
jgi:2-(1,2-epoxy-1,2-dihydrophenyl)acetyl-CoA isomerase